MRYWNRRILAALITALALGNAGNSWGANAVWSEEMTALPNQGPAGQIWAAYDDAGQGTAPFGDWSNPASPGGTIQLVSDPNNLANTGVWKVPAGDWPGQDQGMAVAKENSILPPTGGYADDNTNNSPIKTFSAYTWESRYRLNTTTGIAADTGLEETITFPTTHVGDFEVYPIYFDIEGMGGSAAAPAMRLSGAGYTSIGLNAGYPAPNPFGSGRINVQQGIANRGGQNIAQSSDLAIPLDTWQVLRVTNTWTLGAPDPAFPGLFNGTGEIKVYRNGVLLNTITPTKSGNVNDRSITIRRGAGQGNNQSTEGGAVPDPKWTIPDYMGMEAMFDYIRIVDRVIPIGEALNAPGCGGDVSGSTSGVPDGTTDGADLAYLYNNWGVVPVGTLGDIAGTTGPDGIVDGADVGKIYNCWAQADGGPAPVVPEPASLGILGLGMIGLLATRRRS